jgi:ABC-type hemin transport system ATPase subunit
MGEIIERSLVTIFQTLSSSVQSTSKTTEVQSLTGENSNRSGTCRIQGEPGAEPNPTKILNDYMVQKGPAHITLGFEKYM